MIENEGDASKVEQGKAKGKAGQVAWMVVVR